MENEKPRKEILLEEIKELTAEIELARKARKSSIKIRERLIKLIIELDSLGKEEVEE